MIGSKFLPVSAADMKRLGWDGYDFLLVTGDAYVDHPSFGAAVIGRVLEADGWRIAVLAQPHWQDARAFEAMGRPKYGVLIGAGNLDSMVAHYTAAKKTRSEDAYSPGKKPGMRPDRACIVYANRAREAFPGLPIVIGGMEASLRRFAHYDYWSDKVRRSILFDAKADILSYGMGESSMREIARRLASGEMPETMTDIRGTAVAVADEGKIAFPFVRCDSYETVVKSKPAYANAAKHQYEEHDPVRGKAVVQPHGEKLLVVNPPSMPLRREELDRVSALPYTRKWHPMYDEMGGVPALEEVKFSIIHNRGCFGACNFCALAFHQGRMVTSRSKESVLKEAKMLTEDPDFKGYIHDVGGPTANFRYPSCKKQMETGMCRNRACLAPQPCKNVNADHSEYLDLLRSLRKLPGVKRVFVRSGIRFDYLMLEKQGAFFRELVEHHISGQLKVAPEHCVNGVLDYMGKPHNEVFEAFEARYKALNQNAGKQQFLVPYLISSHPGSTLMDAVRLAEYLKRTGRHPEQVQDFYPTPGTISTCMYHTGIDPRTGKSVYVPKTPEEKAMQRAMLQWFRPENRRLVLKALRETGREDLIGFGQKCLVRPERQQGSYQRAQEKPSSKPASGRKRSKADDNANKRSQPNVKVRKRK